MALGGLSNDGEAELFARGTFSLDFERDALDGVLDRTISDAEDRNFLCGVAGMADSAQDDSETSGRSNANLSLLLH